MRRLILKSNIITNNIYPKACYLNNNEINTMNSYLIQVELINKNNNIKNWTSLTIEIEDNNNFGWSKVFNNIKGE